MKNDSKFIQKMNKTDVNLINYEKSIETITRRTRNLRKSLQKIQKQFDNQAITKFFQKKLKSNVQIEFGSEENACDGFDSDKTSSSSNENDDERKGDDISMKVQAFSAFNHDNSLNGFINEKNSNSNAGSANSTSNQSSIQPANIFLQKPVLHLNIDKQSLEQASSVVINNRLDACRNFATTFNTFNNNNNSNSITCAQSSNAYNTANTSNNQNDDNEMQSLDMESSNVASRKQKLKSKMPKLRKQIPRRCANKCLDSGILDALNNSDSNSCDSGVVSDRSFELNSSDRNKPTTPHRILCPSTTSPSKDDNNQKKQPQTNPTKMGIAKRSRGRPPQDR